MAKKKQIKLSQTLVLFKYLLHQFGVTDIAALVQDLKASTLEGVDENNISHYYWELNKRLFSSAILTREQLRIYDENIVSHTQRINEKRHEPIQWRYFQYIGLLFTEIYLDKYFRDKDALLVDLNAFAKRFNEAGDNAPLFDGNQKIKGLNEAGHQSKLFELSDLNKIAFWQATGSGKTLIMHVNILQYQYYLQRYTTQKNIKPTKVLLVTPNEGLSQQHLEEFKHSNIRAGIFSKQSGGTVSGLFSGSEVEIIEITKLSDESGDKTVAVEAFEDGNNLVLIDEGHRGVAGDKWKNRRDALSANGFAFEYSATFGQAVSAASGTKSKELLEEYSRAILFDYSYKYFYTDGYGKDYSILNVKDDNNAVFMQKYLTGALLSYYQQMKLYRDQPQAMQQFLIEQPLWVFVGGSVNAVRTVKRKQTSDVITIIQFFSNFIKDSEATKSYLQQILMGNDGILNANNSPVFLNRFSQITAKPWEIETLYRDILKTIFNTDNVGANVYLDRLKGTDGELGLRIGDTEDYFGVINVGDDSTLFKLCQSEGILGMERDFSTSLFQYINAKNSKINVLIGAKKFTEGWSSWRVSTMGLMNIGRSEGSQIIQLFGRGVRLKGYGISLKRSSRLDMEQRPSSIPDFLSTLETLNIFGIRADYMEIFKKMLEDEGLPPNDGSFEQIKMPVIKFPEDKIRQLKVIRTQAGRDFKKEVPHLDLPLPTNRHSIYLDWYPKVENFESKRKSSDVQAENEKHYLKANHLAFLDWNTIYLDLQRFKNERSWYNLSIDVQLLPQFFNQVSWYNVAIPAKDMEQNSFDKISMYQEIATTLLKKYIDDFYRIEKQNYLSQFWEVQELEPTDNNFFDDYDIAVEASQTTIIQTLERVAEKIRTTNEFNESERLIGGQIRVFEFMQHLYKPLIYVGNKVNKGKTIIKIKPVALNEGERQFVDDLNDFYQKNESFFDNKQLFLLRNQSRKGIGFFENAGFYPDFLLWLLVDDKQYITFIDPKGLRQVNGFNHPKLSFYKTVKEKIEAQLNDDSIVLNSFIISNTAYEDVKHWKGQDNIDDFKQCHVYFQQERDYYIKQILEAIL
jgi:hypothetical protein